jgi:hypothetical protein
VTHTQQRAWNYATRAMTDAVEANEGCHNTTWLLAGCTMGILSGPEFEGRDPTPLEYAAVWYAKMAAYMATGDHQDAMNCRTLLAGQVDHMEALP